MKRLLLIVLLASCSNPKEQIVEQQKKIQDDISFTNVKEALFSSDARRYPLLKRRELTTIEIDTLTRLEDSANYYSLKKAKLQSEYDSLEMELKKY